MVKKHPPERDPEGFAKVRAAYEEAQALLEAGFVVGLEETSAHPPEAPELTGELADTTSRGHDETPGAEPAATPSQEAGGSEHPEAELSEPISLEAWIAEDEARRRAMLEQVEALVARFEDDPEGVMLEVLELAHEGEALGHSAAERLVFIAAWRGTPIDPELERVSGVGRTRLVYARQLGRRSSSVWPQLPPSVRQLLSCPPWMVFEIRQDIAQKVKRSPETFLQGLLLVDRANGEVADYLATLLGIAPLGAEPNAHGFDPDAANADAIARVDSATEVTPFHRWIRVGWSIMLICAVPFACMVILDDDWPASWLFPYLFALMASSVAVVMLKDLHYRRVVRPALVRMTFEEGVDPGAVVAWAEGDRKGTLSIFLPDIKADPFLAIAAAVAGVLLPIIDEADVWDDEEDAWDDEDDDEDAWSDEGEEDEASDDDYDLGPRERRERARRRRQRRDS